MSAKQRSAVSLAVLVVLAAFVLAGRWYATHRSTPALTATTLTVNVTSADDRGPGTLREALFTADTAPSAANIVIQVSSIVLASALPPIVNPHGIHIEAPADGVTIDAHALSANDAVFDVDADHASLSGLKIRQCPGIAVLVRAPHFRLASSSIEACDVGVEIAGNASAVGLERNHFANDHIGIRFSAASRDTVVVKNEFSGNSTAGIWLVASQPQNGEAISVHDNAFSNGPTGIVLGNIPALLEHNDFTSMREAAVQVIGAGAVVRNNHVTASAAAGILADGARGALIEGNELDHLGGYGIMLRNSSDTLVRSNRIHSCAYGMAFVLGDQQRPNTAVSNALIDLQYNGIDVIGESPILRQNQVLQARVTPLHVVDFTGPNGQVVHAQPLLEKNNFPPGAAASAMPESVRR
jgi:parallel beta-helix repeat protein